MDETSTLVEILQFKSTFPCFRSNRHAVRDFRRRHYAHLSEPFLRDKARRLVAKSLRSTGTYLYDVFQKKTNGVNY